jgi:hypothetical protein
MERQGREFDKVEPTLIAVAAEQELQGVEVS